MAYRREGFQAAPVDGYDKIERIRDATGNPLPEDFAQIRDEENRRDAAPPELTQSVETRISVLSRSRQEHGYIGLGVLGLTEELLRRIGSEARRSLW
jgi:hypothetical protein